MTAVPGSTSWMLGSLCRFLVPGSLIAVTCVIGPEASSQGPVARKQQEVSFDSSRAYEHLRQIVSFGPRPAGSAALEQTRRYIIEQLKAAGVAVAPQPFLAKTPIGEIQMVNLIASIPGTRKERIAITGHYDTKLFREFRFVGANDGGSSTAFLIELARVLKARPHTFTIELIFFDGEEATLRDWGSNDHTYGSQYYVDTASRNGTLSSLKAMVLVDMIAERSPQFMREASSTPWLTDIIWAAAHKLGHRTVFVEAAAPIEDDHVPFLKAGVPATDIIDLDYAAWHTPGDTLDQTSARSLQIVGDVLLSALPAIEARVGRAR